MKYGWIGLGSMATAIIKGMIANGSYTAEQLYGYNRTYEKASTLEKQQQLIACEKMDDLFDADIIVLGVQPQQLDAVFEQLKGHLLPHQLIISLAAGKSIATIQQALDHALVCRVMPNINAVAGASTSGVVYAEACTPQHQQVVTDMFQAIGSIYEIPEHQFDIFSAIAGASPAFTYLYIDSLARAAVLQGMDKSLALEIAASAVLGSGKMVLESSEHPWALVDEVCSPGGTTIQGVTALQNNHFASTIYEAVQAVIEKDRILQ